MMKIETRILILALIFTILHTSYAKEYKLLIEVDEDKEVLLDYLATNFGIEDCKELDKSTIECGKGLDENFLARVRDFLIENNLKAKLVEDTSKDTSSQETVSQKANQEEKPNRKQSKETKESKAVVNKKILNKQCIQVSTASKPPYSLFEKVKDYPFARIEKIGKVYVIRVGLADSIKQLKPILQKVRKDFPSAFIRRCDYIPERIITVSNNLDVSAKVNPPKEKKRIVPLVRSIKKKKENPVEKMYEALNSGNLVEAEKLALRLKNIPRYREDALKVLGIVNIKKKDFKEACKIFHTLYRESSSPDVGKLYKDSCFTYALNRGYENIDTNPKIAIKFFKKSLEFKDSLKAKVGIGYAYLNAGYDLKAYKIFKDLYKKYPQNSDVIEGYITALVKLKKYDELEKIISKLPEEKKKELEEKIVYAKLERIKVLMKNKELNKAEQELLDLYAKYPSNISIMLTLADLYMKKGKYSKAKQFYENVLVLEQNNIYALDGLKGIYLSQGNYEEALKIVEKKKALGYEDEDYEKILSLVYLQQAKEELKQRNIEEALKLATDSYELYPDNPEVLFLLGEIYQKMGDNKKAYEFYAKAYEKAKYDFNVKLRFLYILMEFGFYEQIKAILSKTDTSELSKSQKEKLKKFYRALYKKLAFYHLNEGDYEEARSVAYEGLLMFPDDEDLLSVLAWSCYRLENYECAEKYFKKALKYNKNDENIKLALAYSYINSGKKEKARELLKDLENSTNKDILLEVSNAYLALGDVEKAETVLKKAKKHIQVETQIEQVRSVPESSNVRKHKVKRRTIIPNPFLEDFEDDVILYEEDTDVYLEDTNTIESPYKKKVLEIERKIQIQKQSYLSYIEGGLKYRNRSGTSGRTKLSVISPYVKGEIYLTKKISLYIAGYIHSLDSGDLNDYTDFGSVPSPVIRDVTTSYAVFEPQVGIKYKSRNWRAFIEAGTTPLGDTPVNSTFTGGLGLARIFDNNLQIALSIFRRSEKNTLLSYIGLEDPRSLNSWGRVVENGGKLTVEVPFDENRSLFYAGALISRLKGKNTNTNTRLSFDFMPKFYIGNPLLDEDYLGVFVNLTLHSKNEEAFFFGNGGYFSPRHFIMITPMYEGFLFFNDKKTSIKVKLMLGLLNFKSSQTFTEFAFDGSVIGETLITRRISFSAGIELRRTANYSEFFILGALTYHFGNKFYITKEDILNIETELIR